MKLRNDIGSIKAKVTKVFSSQLTNFSHENLINRDFRKELKLNPYKVAKIIIMIEKLYQIPISEDDSDTFITINDLIKFIDKFDGNKYNVKYYSKSI